VEIDGRDYAGKHLKLERTMPDGQVVTRTEQQLRESIMAELAAAELASLFGVNVAPIRVRRVPLTGPFERFEMITPWIPGRTLDGLTDAQIIAMKDQLADHRVFSLLLGDHDRKLDNYMVDAHGRLIGLDAGQGMMLPVGEYDADHQEEVLEECLNHWLRRSSGGFANDPFLLKQLRLEQSLLKQDMAPAIGRAVELFADPAGQKEIEERLGRAFSQVLEGKELEKAVGTAYELMKRRVEIMPSLKVNEGMQILNIPRNNFPNDEASLWKRSAALSPADGERGTRLVFASVTPFTLAWAA
jgi:hypothetical protein